MPLIELQTSTGTGSFHYTISTPAATSATAIVSDAPTVILIHPVFVSSHIFHPIYADSRPRHFNLVTMDLRGHGATSAEVEDTYGPRTAAGDVLRLMDALNIFAGHVMGISMGACVALEMTVLAPEKVLSLFMVSPLSLTEPSSVAEGRQEIYDCWVHAFDDPNFVDETARRDAFTGSMQLAYNNRQSPLITAIASRAVSLWIHKWGREELGVLHVVGVKFIVDRVPPSVSMLSRIRCPIALIHCSDDIAYPLSDSEELLELLHSAGLNATLQCIDGAPHFGNLTHPEEINKLLYEFVLANSGGAQIPPYLTNVESPFQAELVECGLLNGDSDSDSDYGL
ncbi:Alpha/Beta hydrolase protein [Mycena epipterygia]|nr:Alpha/Beta hydrolase protein [Mycena epipterygia]